MIKCQSCNIKSVEIIEPSDNENYPYRLCKDCHRRLINRALRPLEYFNLTSKHGMTPLLHDDFYEENGEACQPEIKVKNEKALAFPDFDLIKNDLEKLIDYSIVVWWLTDKIVDSLKRFEKTKILDSLKQRINDNRVLGYRLYELAARVLESTAADWIREEWKYHNLDNLMNYSECLAKCLPLSEGFYHYTDVLDKIDNPNVFSEKLNGLISFQSDLSLDWIEKNINRVNNISSSWGYLAVASKFDWKRTKKWLDSGRPLSLVALDTLVNCSVTSETMNSTFWLKENPQRLLNPDSIDNMNDVLNNYLAKDKVTRVKNSIKKIQENWDKILKINE
ncbi:hypothetical protein [Plebeiibacterium sediminum]|nr:hypothetical protein [Plebeiobacterium sediminum]